METVDLVKDLGPLYRPPRDRFVVVDLPSLTYLAVDGEGDPNTSAAFGEATEALFSASYALKFGARKVLGRDHKVAPLEGLWWSDDPASFARRERGQWRWTALILQPPWADEDLVSQTLEELGRRRSLPALPLVRRRDLHEGTCVQRLHIGPFDAEGPVLAELHDTWMPAHGWTFGGPHHEIYLSDMRRTAPERLRTILRQPVVPV
jgi:hypothetical protein